MIYRHTQRGTLILAACLASAALAAVLSRLSGHWTAAFIVPVVMIVLAVLFSSLTVEVTDDGLRWYFGPGLWTYRLGFDEIASVAVVRNRWWYGWGIRIGPGFRLYNVSGLDAVELRLHASDARRIGTDDPDGLAAALRAHLNT